jgi:hypothetical protein
MISLIFAAAVGGNRRRPEEAFLLIDVRSSMCSGSDCGVAETELKVHETAVEKNKNQSILKIMTIIYRKCDRNQQVDSAHMNDLTTQRTPPTA